MSVPAAVLASVAAGLGKKAVDVKVLDLREVATFTDFFVLMSGASVRQVQAIVDEVEEQVRAACERLTHLEGYAQGEWVLLDYSDFIVHVFLPLKREFYDLERLWRDARVVAVPETVS